MNKKLIITAGHLWNDIDAYACAVAYKELCDLKHTPAEIVLSGPLNESITKSVRELKVDYKTELPGNPEDFDYVLVDISTAEHFAKFVIQDHIVALYDHRWGAEKYWQEKLGAKAKIEPVGACATLIWEEFKSAGVQDQISQPTALILYTAIISNTLDLHAEITTDRDKQAIKELHHFAQIPEDWIETYYNQVAESFFNDPENAMKNDTKIIQAGGEEYGIIQVELWDSESFIKKNHDLIKKVLSEIKTQHTFLTSPSISREHNFLVTDDELVKSKLQEKIQATFKDNLGTTTKLWLRKEIMRNLNS